MQSEQPGDLTEEPSSPSLYILMASVHGLVRGTDMELGRDPDTGGQIKYVVELARALAQHPDVEQVDLVTRQVFDRKVDDLYAEPFEDLGHGARIVRIPFGPKRYLRKERLWPYLDSLTDQTLAYLHSINRVPDLVHGHYADAGYVGSQIARLLGVPFLFTGHSLGRVKRQRLLDQGAKAATLDSRYSFANRIEAEEVALDTAGLVIASTRQEIEEQYALYEHYVPERMEVIPPGVDLDLFNPPGEAEVPSSPLHQDIQRFLKDPSKPMVLAMARPDERKNLGALVEAYAETPGLRDRANLVLVAGNRDEIGSLDAGARRVLTNLLLQVDRYDLYGSVALPKQHRPNEVPGLYRAAAASRGVFVNPALTEPFGLTLIEAAASGLPIVATNDGGPRDILEACRSGYLVDPMDTEEIGRALMQVLDERETPWDTLSTQGVEGARERFSWSSHAASYLRETRRLLTGDRPGSNLLADRRSRLPTVDRMLITDIDNTLTGDKPGQDALFELLQQQGDNVGFGIATGRKLKQALEILEELDAPQPDLLITSVGAEIYYGKNLVEDRSWRKHIDHQWSPDRVREALEDLPGVETQPDQAQGPFKLSYFLHEEAPDEEAIMKHLRSLGLRVNLVTSFGSYLDILPIRATAGMAIRFLMFKWGLAPDRFLIAGDSGNDEDMLSGDTLGVVVGNYSQELEKLRGHPRIYFAETSHAWGIMEGIEHYRFFDDIRLPEEEEEEEYV